ncbi:MAG: class I SAM-dependent methyltransferase [Promethearchaeota archaeon]
MVANKKKERKFTSNLDFRVMSFFFKMRDLIHPPIEKLEKIVIQPGDIVLDYGCGSGSYTFKASELVGPSGKIYAIDIHPLALKKIEKKAKKKNLNNIETFRTECKTNIEDNSVDIIICFDVIHELNNLNAILSEFHRVLKPTGKLSVDDHHSTKTEIISKITQNGLFKLKDSRDKIYNFIKLELLNSTNGLQAVST